MSIRKEDLHLLVDLVNDMILTGLLLETRDYCRS